MRNIVKPAIGLALLGLMSVSASADRLSDLNLSRSQRQQIRQILRNGNPNDASTRQQVYGILSNNQRQQLGMWGGNGYYNNGYYNNGYNQSGWYPNNGYSNSGWYPNNGYNPGYLPNNGYYNNGYYNNGYYPNNGYNVGINILGGLLQSGLLNGFFR